MKRVLVSGASGHIGSVVCELLNSDMEVIQLCRSSIRDENKCTRVISYDLLTNLSKNELKNYLGSIDVFIHVASEIDYSPNNTQLTYFNVSVFHSVLVKLKEIEVDKVILISGAPLVGYRKDKILTETMIEVPPSLYHFTKFCQEQILQFMTFENFYSLRVSSPISSRMNKSTIFSVFMDKAMNNDNIEVSGKGTRKQNYIDVRDVAELCYKIVKQKLPSGTYNVCSSKSISNLELAKRIIKTISSKSTIELKGEDSFDNTHWEFDVSKAKIMLGFSCKYSLTDTIIDYLRNNKK
jgi:nucleoside-diphosphate-sugar epimerase